MFQVQRPGLIIALLRPEIVRMWSIVALLGFHIGSHWSAIMERFRRIIITRVINGVLGIFPLSLGMLVRPRRSLLQACMLDFRNNSHHE